MSKYVKFIAQITRYLKELGGGQTVVVTQDKKGQEKGLESKQRVSECLAKIVDMLNSMDANESQSKALPFDKPEGESTAPSKGPSPSGPGGLAELNDLMNPLVSGDLPLLIFSRMHLLTPEDYKNIQHIYQFLFRNKRQETVSYFLQHPQILHILVQGYTTKAIAMTSGALLREVNRDEKINLTILHSKELFDPFFDFVQGEQFDIAADAFETFKLMLTKHPKTAGKFLQENSTRFLSKYNVLIEKGNYVTKRQALKVLGELLTSRTNFHFMMGFINDPVELEVIINCFQDSHKAIKFEAFHVFKIFVANPRKTPPIIEILLRERERLTAFLQVFDWLKFKEQFAEEKAMILSVLSTLTPPSGGKEKKST